MITAEQLRAAVPTMPPDLAARAAAAANQTMPRFCIATPRQQAGFLGQALHESCGFTRMVENLNYRADALLKIWPKRFTLETARLYGRIDGVKPANQQMIANTAYANRMGNGSVESGDGWRYRGRGPGQLTGLDNYNACGRALGLDLLNCPDQVAQLETGLAAFAWFWKSNGLNELADAGKVDQVSARVNGGDLGLQARRDLTDALLKVLA